MQRNTVMRLTAYLLLVLLAGCAAIRHRVDNTLRERREKAHVSVAGLDSWVCSRADDLILIGGSRCVATVSTVDGKLPVPSFGPYDVGPGAHSFVVAVPWSNGYQDQ